MLEILQVSHCRQPCACSSALCMRNVVDERIWNLVLIKNLTESCPLNPAPQRMEMASSLNAAPRGFKSPSPASICNPHYPYCLSIRLSEAYKAK